MKFKKFINGLICHMLSVSTGNNIGIALLKAIFTHYSLKVKVASNYFARIHVECLGDKELNYGLKIRKALKSSDVRRRTVLNSLLTLENDVYCESLFDMEEIGKSYNELNEIYANDKVKY